jgi:hypothetical protein
MLQIYDFREHRMTMYEAIRIRKLPTHIMPLLRMSKRPRV